MILRTAKITERRRYPRVEITCPVFMETNRTLISGTTKDISAGGAFIQCLEPLEAKEVFELAISVPCSNPPIKAIAEVVRLHNSNPNNGHDQHGMAVQFIIISDEYRKVISELVLDRLESKAII